MADNLVTDMIKAGYVLSPNNIHSLPGHLMYAGGPGIWTVKNDVEIQVLHDRIRVFRQKFFGTQYSLLSYWDTITEAVFTSVEDLLKWCEQNGEISEPGQPAHPQNWD